MTERSGARESAALETTAPSSARSTNDESAAEEGVERLLKHVPDELPAVAARSNESPPGLRAARVVRFDPKTCEVEVALRGTKARVRAIIDDAVETEVVERAAEQGDLVLVETAAGEAPIIVGVLLTRIPRAVELRGETITIEAEREVLLRAGSAAVRLREDGEIEVVGSRVSTFSRGVLRLVGRVLRLN